MNNKRVKLKAVDFFCSGGGMSYGMQKAGIDIVGGIDIDLTCKTTYEANIKNAKFIHADIFDFKVDKLKGQLNITKNDDNLIFIGCSPCQYWSIMRTNKNKAVRSKKLLLEFLRFIKYYKPGYIIVENVPGILRNRQESRLNKFIATLEKNGYQVNYSIVDISDYGVPQSRKRFALLANRVGKELSLPTAKKGKKRTVREIIGDSTRFPKIPAGHKDSTAFLHTTAGLSETNIKRLKKTPKDGGTRSAWANTILQLETYKQNKVNFSDTYGRMSWDKPAPTITTKFFSISCGRFAHPVQNRAISLREGAALQTFPNTYRFLGPSIAGIARIIGNAVPPLYAKQLGKAIRGDYEQ